VGKVSKLSLTIDNQKVTTEEGTSILEAARSAGIDIPSLCYHEKLAPRGACRLCLVEITKGKKKRLVTSCVYLAEEGLKVETESEPVVRIRKMLLELMLASSPGVKAIQDYARRYGITRSRFDIEPDFCILCGLCVRYCNEVKGKNAIGFVGRGTQRKVMFFPDIAAEECPKCGECFPLCPTGVIPSNYALAKLPHFTYNNIRL
jgi:bidirectional [NiFe] hydrogenase diaphorase subunit